MYENRTHLQLILKEKRAIYQIMIGKKKVKNVYNN